MDISLELLLKSRDLRQATQRRLLEEYKGKSLVCLTVIMPGKEKRNSLSLFVAKCGTEILEKTFKEIIIHEEKRDLDTGFEAFYVMDAEPLSLKSKLCRIEEEHPLGRLFDMDVINFDGIPITRKEIGFEPRKCLICEKESRFCMRNFSHTQEELQNKIREICTKYKQNQNIL